MSIETQDPPKTATAKGQVFPLFPTPCYRRDHAGLRDMNRELAALVLAQEQAERNKSGASVSIKNGYHSDNRFFDKQEPCVRQLRELVTANFDEYVQSYWAQVSHDPIDRHQPLKTVLWGWSVVMREGAHSSLHMHPYANISGVYYVQTPNEAEVLSGANARAGWIHLQDPRSAAYAFPIPGQFNNMSIPPMPGSMIMFPSFLEHYVTPFQGAGARISIAFNFRFVHRGLAGE